MTARDHRRAALLCLATAAGSLGCLCAEKAPTEPFVDTHLLGGGLVAAPETPAIPALKAGAPASGSAHEQIRAAVRAAYPFAPTYDPPASVSLAPDPNLRMLPTVVVRNRPLYGVDVDSMLSDAGLFALQAKKFMGATTRYQDPRRIEHGLPNYAVLMYRDQKRQKNMKDLNDMVSLLDSTGDGRGAKELRELIQDTFIRHETPLEDAMDRSINWGRR